MKKIFLAIILFYLASFIFAPFAINAADSGLVKCTKNCGIGDFFSALAGIYEFIVFKLATPLAVIAITVGGILMMISAGNPNLLGAGKKTLYAGIIGLVLAFGSYMIVDWILKAINFQGNWASPF